LRRAVSYLRYVIDARRTARLKQIAILAAGVATALAVIAVSLLTARIRWFVLGLLGRRWIFVGGSCSNIADIVNNRIIVRSIRDADPTAVSREICEWPPSDEIIDHLRSRIPKAGSLLVIADDSAFRKPWAHTLGSNWSEGDEAIVAGQICLAPQLGRATIARERSLRFCGLRCAASPGMERLGAVDGEVAAVTKLFRAWGAAVDQIDSDATIAEVGIALSTADVVHIAAHATGSGILLADGVFDASRLAASFGPNIRCKLLVLSACEAGKVDDDHSLVYNLVLSGVNVIASLSLVGDRATLALFEEFYRALLPRRSAQGVELAEAARSAGAECARRLGDAEAALRGQDQRGTWKTSIDAFMLYGDPSVSLSLERRRS
jgi:hypothetical protein